MVRLNLLLHRVFVFKTIFMNEAKKNRLSPLVFHARKRSKLFHHREQLKPQTKGNEISLHIDD